MRIKLKIIPNAAKTELAGHDDDRHRIRIAAPAVNGKANKKLIEFLAKVCGVPKAGVRIVHGENSRIKLVEVPDGSWPPQFLSSSSSSPE